MCTCDNQLQPHERMPNVCPVPKGGIITVEMSRMDPETGEWVPAEDETWVTTYEPGELDD